MKTIRTAIQSVRVPLLASALVFLASTCLGGQAGKDLIINGQVASKALLTINGRAYVPVSDVAKALNLTVVNNGNSIELVPAGGANEVKGLRGKLGDQFQTTMWRFTPVSLNEMDTYTTKFNGDMETINPRSKGETLFVMNCRIKNGQNEVREMVFTQRKCGNTALADTQEHSYAPMAYDAHNETGPYGGPKMLPGSAAEFAVIFSVPKGTQPKDILFAIISDKDLAEEKAGKPLGTELRISAQK